MSCGGFVDAGETPEAAALREAHEEYGLKISAHNLQFISKIRKNRPWPRLHRRDRLFLYCYTAIVDDASAPLDRLQKVEVSWAGLISFHQAHALLRKHRLKGIGRLEPYYHLYARLLRATEQAVRAKSAN